MNQWYRLIVEIYQVDKVLFNKTSVSAINNFCAQLGETALTKHVHEYSGTHMVYYYRQVADFKNTTRVAVGTIPIGYGSR